MSSSAFNSVYALANLTAPASGVTHAAKWLVSITAGTPATLNMLSQMEFLGDFLGQAMTFDNSVNTDAVTIFESTYGWTEVVQGGSKRTFQYPGCNNQNFTFSSSGNITAVLSIYDWPAFPDGSYNLANASGTPVSIVGTVQTQDAVAEGYLLNLQPGYTPVSRSITLAGTGASVPLMAANPARRVLYVSAAYMTGGFTDTWFNFLGGAASVGGLDCVDISGPSNPTAAGSYVPTTAINVWDDTSFVGGAVVTAWEG